MGKLKTIGIGIAASLWTSASFAATEVHYWSFWNEPEPQAKVIKALIAEFEAANPGVKFKIAWNGRENQTTVRNALTGGANIDLMDADMDGLNGGIAGQGAALPLDDLLASASADSEAALSNELYAPLLANAKINGATSQVPYAFNTYQIFYNKGVLKNAGVNSVPVTWSEFVTAMTAVKDSGKNAIAVEGDIAFYNINWFNYLIARIAGPDFLLKAVEDKTGETWRDPAVRKALEFETALWSDGLIPAESKGYQWPAAQETVAFGETAAELVGSWLPTELADKVDDGFQWGAMNFPTVEDGAGNVDDMIIYAISYVVPKDAENAKIAKDFIRFALSKKSQTAMANEANIGVANAGVDWPGVLAESQQAVAGANVLLSENLGLKVAYTDYSKNVYEATHNKFFLGQITADEFVDQMVEQTINYWKNR